MSAKIKNVIVVVVFFVISCFLIVIMQRFSARKILENAQKSIEKTMKEVFPYGDSFQPIFQTFHTSTPNITLDQPYIVKSEDKVVGAVIQVEGPTYDRGTIMVGITTEGIITGVHFMELSDSSGFGQKACDSKFLLPSGKNFCEQFAGKDGSNELIAGRNYDAISGATITSRRSGVLIQEGCHALLEYFGGQNE